MKCLLLSGLLLLAACQDNCEFMGYEMPCKTAFELSEQKALYYNVALQESAIYPGKSLDQILDIHFYMENRIRQRLGYDYKNDSLLIGGSRIILK